MIWGSFLLLPHFLFILLLHIPLLKRREYKSGFPPSPIHYYTLPVPSLVISGLSLPSLISFTSFSISFHHCPVFQPHTGKHTRAHTHAGRFVKAKHVYTSIFLFLLLFNAFSTSGLHPPPQKKSILNPTSNLYLFWSFLPSFLASLWRKVEREKKKEEGWESRSGRLTLERILCRQAAVNQCNCVWFLKPWKLEEEMGNMKRWSSRRSGEKVWGGMEKGRAGSWQQK